MKDDHLSDNHSSGYDADDADNVYLADDYTSFDDADDADDGDDIDDAENAVSHSSNDHSSVDDARVSVGDSHSEDDHYSAYDVDDVDNLY